MLTLTPQGPASYRCSEPVAIATWLVEQNYRAEDPRSSSEYLRLRWRASLIVVYHNGTVLLQGSDLATPRQLFEGIMDRPVTTAPLPF